MKKFLIGISFLIISNLSIAQNQKNKSTNEVSFSYNRPTDSHPDMKPNSGIGICANHIFFNSKKVNFITGIEYNRTRITHQTDFYYYGQHLHYTINSIGSPLLIRLNFGERTVFFIETGIFFDYLISTHQTGLVQKYDPLIDSYKTVDVNENVNYTKTDYGFKGGVGVTFHIKSIELFIKNDLVLGMKFVRFDNTEFFNRYFRLSMGIRI